MRAPELIRKTRDGVPLEEAEIRFMVFGALVGAVTEAQIGAWLMAITLRGLSRAETLSLAQVFLESGRRLDLSFLPGITVDKRIYAIRDTTATVESLPLIASSIMSKKLAAGADAFVFDVKFGRGAIMKEPAAARELAELLNELARRAGKRSTAFLTSMEQPL